MYACQWRAVASVITLGRDLGDLDYEPFEALIALRTRFAASGAVSLLFHAGVPIAYRCGGAPVSLNPTVQIPSRSTLMRTATTIAERCLRFAARSMTPPLRPIACNHWRVEDAPGSPSLCSPRSPDRDAHRARQGPSREPLLPASF